MQWKFRGTRSPQRRPLPGSFGSRPRDKGSGHLEDLDLQQRQVPEARIPQDVANLSEALGGLHSRPPVVHGGDGQRTVAVQVSNPRAAVPQHMEEAHVKLCIALRKAVFKHTWLRNNEELELRAASGGSVPPTMVTCST